jgi:hypothetical protein
MFIALVVVTVLLAVICVQSAAMKLRKNEQVLAVIHGTVGVPQRHLPVLAALELAGAAGILAGLWVEPLGVAAAVGLVAYGRRPPARPRHQEPRDADAAARARRRRARPAPSDPLRRTSSRSPTPGHAGQRYMRVGTDGPDRWTIGSPRLSLGARPDAGELGARLGGKWTHRAAQGRSGVSEKPGILRIHRASRSGTGLTRGFEPRHSPHAEGSRSSSLTGAFLAFQVCTGEHASRALPPVGANWGMTDGRLAR